MLLLSKIISGQELGFLHTAAFLVFFFNSLPVKGISRAADAETNLRSGWL